MLSFESIAFDISRYFAVGHNFAISSAFFQNCKPNLANLVSDANSVAQRTNGNPKTFHAPTSYTHNGETVNHPTIIHSLLIVQ
jgi:hypothetical protein